MNNEKQNSWKEKLASLEDLPETPAFDKDTAWEKLQSRLNKKPVHRPTALYWVAAALLLVLLLPFLVKKQNTGTRPDAIVKQKNALPAAVPGGFKKEQPTVMVLEPVKKANNHANSVAAHRLAPVIKAVQPSITGNHSPSVETIPAEKTRSLAVVLPAATKLPVVHYNELDAPVNQAALATVTVPAKKLSVVHVNEVEKASAEQVAVAQLNPLPSPYFERKKRFLIQFNKVNMTTPLASAHPDDAHRIIIKIPYKN